MKNLVVVFRVLLFMAFAIFSAGVAAYAFGYPLMPANSGSIFLKLALSDVATPLHIVGGGVALLISPLQFIPSLRTRCPEIHHVVGLLYCVAIIFSASAGFVLAMNAHGGMAAGSGFALLSVLWIGFTVWGLVCAIRKKFTQHQIWLQRSAALTFAAVTLRLMLGIGLSIFQLDYIPLYIFTAWSCWLINLMLLEGWRYRHSILRGVRFTVGARRQAKVALKG